MSITRSQARSDLDDEFAGAADSDNEEEKASKSTDSKFDECSLGIPCRGVYAETKQAVFDALDAADVDIKSCTVKNRKLEKTLNFAPNSTEQFGEPGSKTRKRISDWLDKVKKRNTENRQRAELRRELAGNPRPPVVKKQSPATKPTRQAKPAPSYPEAPAKTVPEVKLTTPPTEAPPPIQATKPTFQTSPKLAATMSYSTRARAASENTVKTTDHVREPQAKRQTDNEFNPLKSTSIPIVMDFESLPPEGMRLGQNATLIKCTDEKISEVYHASGIGVMLWGQTLQELERNHTCLFIERGSPNVLHFHTPASRMPYGRDREVLMGTWEQVADEQITGKMRVEVGVACASLGSVVRASLNQPPMLKFKLIFPTGTEFTLKYFNVDYDEDGDDHEAKANAVSIPYLTVGAQQEPDQNGNQQEDSHTPVLGCLFRVAKLGTVKAIGTRATQENHALRTANANMAVLAKVMAGPKSSHKSGSTPGAPASVFGTGKCQTKPQPVQRKSVHWFSGIKSSACDPTAGSSNWAKLAQSPPKSQTMKQSTTPPISPGFGLQHPSPFKEAPSWARAYSPSTKQATSWARAFSPSKQEPKSQPRMTSTVEPTAQPMDIDEQLSPQPASQSHQSPQVQPMMQPASQYDQAPQAIVSQSRQAPQMQPKMQHGTPTMDPWLAQQRASQPYQAPQVQSVKPPVKTIFINDDDSERTDAEYSGMFASTFCTEEPDDMSQWDREQFATKEDPPDDVGLRIYGNVPLDHDGSTEPDIEFEYKERTKWLDFARGELDANNPEHDLNISKIDQYIRSLHEDYARIKAEISFLFQEKIAQSTKTDTEMGGENAHLKRPREEIDDEEVVPSKIQTLKRKLSPLEVLAAIEAKRQAETEALVMKQLEEKLLKPAGPKTTGLGDIDLAPSVSKGNTEAPQFLQTETAVEDIDLAPYDSDDDTEALERLQAEIDAEEASMVRYNAREARAKAETEANDEATRRNAEALADADAAKMRAEAEAEAKTETEARDEAARRNAEDQALADVDAAKMRAEAEAQAKAETEARDEAARRIAETQAQLEENAEEEATAAEAMLAMKLQNATPPSKVPQIEVDTIEVTTARLPPRAPRSAKGKAKAVKGKEYKSKSKLTKKARTDNTEQDSIAPAQPIRRSTRSGRGRRATG